MNDEQVLTVAQLLPDHFTHVGERVDRELRDSAEAERIGIPSFVWNCLDAPVSAAIHSALDLDVFAMLAEGWRSAQELRELAKSTRSAGTRAEWVLGTHAMTSSVHPVLQISVPGYRFRPLRFTLELSVEISAVQLSIFDGRMTAAAGVDCTLVAQLKYGEAKLHDPKKSRHFKPFGVHAFAAPGIEIPLPSR